MSSTRTAPSPENSTGCSATNWRNCSIDRTPGAGRRNGARIIAARTGAFLLLACGLALAAGAERPEQSAEQLEKLRNRIQAVEQSLEADRSRRDELRAQLEESERNYAELAATLGGLREQIAEQTARRRRTEQQRREADAELQRQKLALARQVRASYVIGQRGQTKLVLNQDGGQRLSRVVTYYDYFNRARARHIETILDQVQALAGLAEQLRRDTAELDETRSRHEDTLAALETLRGEREGMVERLRRRIAGGEGELQQLQADERQLTRLLREVRKTLADIPAQLGGPPFAKLRGQLPWPLKGRLLARYGQPKSGRIKWNGLWISGPEGASVKAVAAGRVAYTGWMHRYGLIVVLEHEGAYYSLYGHAQSVDVAVGDWVQPGDVIAAAGATGGHDRNGLYFELRKGTDPVNPSAWFQAPAARPKSTRK